MAVFLRKELSPDSRITFDSIEFIEEESVFVLEARDDSFKINVEYIPKVEREFENKNFTTFLLSNAYLNAENDVFEIFEKELNTRIGWLFPIQVLESNENDFSDNEYLNKYKFPATIQLLSITEQTKLPTLNTDRIYSITDFYHDNICIFVLCNDALPNEFEFKIQDYLPSLSNYGYYKWNSDLPHLFEEKEPLVLSYRGKKKLKFQRSNSKISDNEFLVSLYEDHLISIDHFLIKFIFLYQVVEYLMDENFNLEFTRLIKEYENEEITKNDLKEQINEIAKERGNIGLMLQKTQIDNELENNFKRDATDFLSSFKKNIKPDLGNLIYDVRNLVTHNYREIIKSENNIRLLDLITQQFEFIINDMLITYQNDSESEIEIEN
jgi:hypothetical protein